MAGTLFGLGLSQQVDATGTPLSGALLYVYEENSSTPSQTFADFTLSTLQTFPIEADSAGRLPQIWVEDGSYRARLTTSDGVEVFDEASVTAIGASSTTGGGSSGSSVDSSAIFATGDTLWVPVNTTRSGWVRANGRSLGNGASGATERANSDTQSLFEYLWNTYADATCAVSGGRGASAVADFNASKTIGLLDMRSRAAFGVDDMGNTARAITGGSTAAAAVVGKSTYTIAQSQLPNVNLSATALTATPNESSVHVFATSGSDNTHTGSGSYIQSISTSPLTIAMGGTIPLGGSGVDIDILTPALVGTWYLKL